MTKSQLFAFDNKLFLNYFNGLVIFDNVDCVNYSFSRNRMDGVVSISVALRLICDKVTVQKEQISLNEIVANEIDTESLLKSLYKKINKR